eukprot:snap_masked-scaffold_1-processed-gene-9.48-mRNA-1 protein AED:1.00 eAED:1.00 QI:0/0/0/0/1/1/2/0/67
MFYHTTAPSCKLSAMLLNLLGRNRPRAFNAEYVIRVIILQNKTFPADVQLAKFKRLEMTMHRLIKME